MPLQLEDPLGVPSSDAIQHAANNRKLRELLNGTDPFPQYLLESVATTKGDILVATAASTIVRKGVGSNGQYLMADSAQSDSMRWVGTLTQRALFPLGLYAANNTDVTAFASGTSYFVYVGRLLNDISALRLFANVTTAAVTITWAEVAMFKGQIGASGVSTDLTRLGSTDVSASYNSTGLKNTTVNLTGATAGDDLWLVMGSSATTPFQVRGLLADNVQSGVFRSVAGQPSTLSTPVTVAVEGTTTVPPRIFARP